MKRSEIGLHPGGLMRCCTQSAADWVQADPDAEVKTGEKIACRYENKETMIVDEHDGRLFVRWAEELQ